MRGKLKAIKEQLKADREKRQEAEARLSKLRAKLKQTKEDWARFASKTSKKDTEAAARLESLQVSYDKVANDLKDAKFRFQRVRQRLLTERQESDKAVKDAAAARQVAAKAQCESDKAVKDCVAARHEADKAVKDAAKARREADNARQEVAFARTNTDAASRRSASLERRLHDETKAREATSKQLATVEQQLQQLHQRFKQTEDANHTLCSRFVQLQEYLRQVSTMPPPGWVLIRGERAEYHNASGQVVLAQTLIGGWPLQLAAASESAQSAHSAQSAQHTNS